MKPLRTLLVGVDHPHGPLWRESLMHHPGYHIVAAVDDDPDRARSLLGREDLSIPISQSITAACADTLVDAAVVTLPNDATPAALTTLARDGLPMIAEKPCAPSAAAFGPALEAIGVSQVPFLPAYVRRFSSVAVAIRDAVASGAIGELLAVDVAFTTTNVATRNAAYLAGRTVEEVRAAGSTSVELSTAKDIHWLFDRQRSGGGIMHWLGVHWIDLALMLTGERVLDVSSHLATRTDNPRINVEDVASVTMSLESEAIATITCAYALQHGPDRTSVSITGSGGWIAWDGSSTAWEIQQGQADSIVNDAGLSHSEQHPGYAGDMGWAALDAFHNAVTASAPLPVGPETARDILQILDAIHCANDTRQSVRIV